MSNGIVVDHKESGVRYAISERNFNPKVHKKVRDLNPGETVRGFTPKGKVDQDHTEVDAQVQLAKDELAAQKDTKTKTEGSSAEGTKDATK